jgi:hypothetical protein
VLGVVGSDLDSPQLQYVAWSSYAVLVSNSHLLVCPLYASVDQVIRQGDRFVDLPFGHEVGRTGRSSRVDTSLGRERPDFAKGDDSKPCR